MNQDMKTGLTKPCLRSARANPARTTGTDFANYVAQILGSSFLFLLSQNRLILHYIVRIRILARAT